jgi:hypothetical protein
MISKISVASNFDLIGEPTADRHRNDDAEKPQNWPFSACESTELWRN